jgi:dihydropteroate synthase
VVDEEYVSFNKLMSSITLPRDRTLMRDKTRVMAILNITDDSFSGDGTLEPHVIVQQAEAALRAGATILDLGAESTRPGARAISAEEECARLLPALHAVRAAFPDAVVSIDTTKASVFEQAAAAGADILNSVIGLPSELCQIAAKTQCAVVINNPGGRNAGSVGVVLQSLQRDAQMALDAGVPAESILLDPGLGFGKTPDENIALMKDLPLLHQLGYATLIGFSRKSTLGYLTGQPVDQREFATTATTAIAAMAKIDFVRVHNVAASMDALAVANAIRWGWRPESWAV